MSSSEKYESADINFPLDAVTWQAQEFDTIWDYQHMLSVWSNSKNAGNVNNAAFSKSYSGAELIPYSHYP